MTRPHETIESTETLCEALAVDYPTMTIEEVNRHIDELYLAGYLQKKLWDDQWLYHATESISWQKVSHLSCPVKKKLLLQLIEDPSVFFVLYNTQKGKLRIAGRELYEASQHPEYRTVGFFFVSNDQALASQTTDGLYDCFPLRPEHETAHLTEKHQVRIFQLSSNTKTSFSEIRTYIDAYASPYSTKEHMPVIPALANAKQVEKVIKLMYHIYRHGNTRLRAVVLWDEADSIYPALRAQKFCMEDGCEVSFLDLMQFEDSRIYKTGFITATEGELLDEFDECANAIHYRTELAAEDAPYYRAIHHPESVLHLIAPVGREDNNILCKRIIDNNWVDHFNTPIILSTGENYYRKTIINSTPTTADHADLAQFLVALGGNCLTFNQRGLTIFSANTSIHGKRIPIRRRRFGEVLFVVYKEYGLHDRPLFIVGRRKIDRGLGFHWAPRHNTPESKRKKELPGSLPSSPAIRTDGHEGLIWSDVILGNRIMNIATATQKAGRGAGIIAQCAQYPGSIHYWGISDTLDAVKRQASKVDLANTLPGTNTMLQAVETANALLPKEPVKRHAVDPATFRILKASTDAQTFAIATEIVKDVLGHRFRSPAKIGDKFVASLNDKAAVRTLLDAVKGVPGAYGYNKLPDGTSQKKFRYAIPAYCNDQLHMVIPLIDPGITDEQKATIDSVYRVHLVEYPQEDIITHV